MLGFKQGSTGVCRGYLQEDLLIRCMAFESYSFWEPVGNICVLQAELIRKAQLPHEIFPIHVLLGLLLGSAQPRHTDHKPAIGLFPNASAVACLVTTSVSMCCNSYSPPCLALLPPLPLPSMCGQKPLMY